MARMPHHESGQSRRVTTGVTPIAAATMVAIARAYVSSAMPRGALTIPNPSGVIGIVGADGLDADNPFFRELGTNGRSCVTCHRPAQGWSIAPAELRDRFNRTDGLDPIFRPNDGSNCEGAGRAAAVLPRRLRRYAGGCDQVLRHAVLSPIHRTGEGRSARVSSGTLTARILRFDMWAIDCLHALDRYPCSVVCIVLWAA
jgi:hypothetical protein